MLENKCDEGKGSEVFKILIDDPLKKKKKMVVVGMVSLLPSTAMVAAAVVVGAVSFLLYLCYEILWGRPERLREKMRRQGIKGPTPSLVYGNILEMKRIKEEVEEEENASKGGADPPPVASDYAISLFPYFDRWSKEYGPIFMYSTGSIQLLYMSHPDLVKEIGQYKSLDLGRPTYMQKERGPLFGRGILTSNGDVWVHQRKVIAPEFFMDKIKGMVDLMVKATIPLLELWESRVESEGGIGEITVDEDLRNFSADVISRACFGSSYSQGKEIFSKLRALQQTMSKPSLLIGIPWMRYLPTKNNREVWRLEREIRLLVLNIVKDRKEKSETSGEKDLLQSILDSAAAGHVGLDTTETFIVDNCKNIYFAGHETTAISACWCLMLLASYPEWQAHARAEVVEVCGGQLPDVDMLKKMKTLTMVIQESLRLYSPAAFVSREALKDLKLGDFHIPKGLNIWVPISVIHQNTDIWGPDAHEFNPQRFSSGISGACKLPHAYIPFGLGPRTCLGQNLAIVELKIVLSLILSKFTFSLSPKYRHNPAFKLIIEPEFGVCLTMKKA